MARGATTFRPDSGSPEEEEILEAPRSGRGLSVVQAYHDALLKDKGVVCVGMANRRMA